MPGTTKGAVAIGSPSSDHMPAEEFVRCCGDMDLEELERLCCSSGNMDVEGLNGSDRAGEYGAGESRRLPTLITSEQ